MVQPVKRLSSRLVNATATEAFDRLNTIKVPLTGLRWELSQLVKEGHNEYPLGDLLLVIQTVIRQKE